MNSSPLILLYMYYVVVVVVFYNSRNGQFSTTVNSIHIVHVPTKSPSNRNTPSQLHNSFNIIIRYCGNVPIIQSVSFMCLCTMRLRRTLLFVYYLLLSLIKKHEGHSCGWQSIQTQHCQLPLAMAASPLSFLSSWPPCDIEAFLKRLARCRQTMRSLHVW